MIKQNNYRTWPQEKLEEMLSSPISALDLSVRITNKLEAKGIFIINDLLYCTKNDILCIRHFGEKSYDNIISALYEAGFY